LISFKRVSLGVLLLSAGLALAPQALAQQKDGGTIFRQRCQMCHVTAAGQKAGLGPNLSGLVGRKAAGTDFLYSAALKGSGLKWDKATLDTFLTAPAKMVPGTRMAISVSNPADRAALIDYLATLKK
jgi:cytochrome c